jgi:hydrogenase-4 component H
MFRVLAAALRKGRITESLETLQAAAPAAKGRPNLDTDHCDGNGACQTACPTSAIVLGVPRSEGNRSFTLDYGACVFCGRCAAACLPGALTMTGDYALATLRREDLVLHAEVSSQSEDRKRLNNA